MLGHYSVGLSETAGDPRRGLESALAALSLLLRSEPTVPLRSVGDHEAALLPRKHCAFEGCAWGGDCDRELYDHVAAAHGGALGTVVDLMPAWHPIGARREAAYNGAISIRVQQGAPLANFAIDRRCIRNFAEATHDNRVACLICFSCARRFVSQPGVPCDPIRYLSVMHLTSMIDEGYVLRQRV